MKIVISAKGPDLEAQVDPRFGRSPYFLIVDTESMAYEVLPNGESSGRARGRHPNCGHGGQPPAGRRCSRGNCGPKAFHTLQAAGISVVVGVEGSVRDAVQNYQAGKFQPAPGPNVASHWR
jgi:predicted Fe-Mo cluster-binding NifX family protein